MLDGQGIRHWKVRGNDVIWGVFPAFGQIRKITSLFCRNPLSLRKSVNSVLFNRLLRQRRVEWLGSSFQPPWCSNLIPSRHFFPWCFVKEETYVLPIAITLNNVKDRIRTAVGHSEYPFIAKCRYLVRGGLSSWCVHGNNCNKWSA
jgi:hypothetical protein